MSADEYDRATESLAVATADIARSESAIAEGQKALITAMAERVHPEALPPGVQVYTRQITLAWLLFFVGMIVLSLVIYATAPWPWWSFFCTVLTPALAIAAFVGEYGYRRWAHPEFERVSMQRAVQAWRTRASRESL